MAPRIRTVKPGIWQNEEFGTASYEARLLFLGLITQADDDGRQKGSPRQLKSLVFPYDDVTPAEIDTWLAELESAEMILRYSDDSARPYIYLPGWRDHQSINKPTPSKLPAPPALAGDSGSTTGVLPDYSRGKGRERKGGERKGILRQGAVAPDDAPPLCQLLYQLILANGSRKPTIGQKWIDAERLLLERDKRDPIEAENLIRWCQKDDFWRSNILSMPKFREKYDTLRLQAARRQPGRPSTSVSSGQSVRDAVLGSESIEAEGVVEEPAPEGGAAQ